MCAIESNNNVPDVVHNENISQTRASDVVHNENISQTRAWNNYSRLKIEIFVDMLASSFNLNDIELIKCV